MAFLQFKMRNVKRDQETDRVRMKSILDVIALQISEIESEWSGLKERYRHAVDDAAFAFEAFENGDDYLSHKVDALSDTVSRYTERMTLLEKQATYLRETRQGMMAAMVSWNADALRRHL